MGKPINGSDLMLFIDSTGEGTAFKSIAFATSHSLSISAETVETSSKDTGGKCFSTDDENVWMGVTVTRSSEKKRLEDLKRNIKAKHYHVTFEPIFDEIGEIDFAGIDWVVIGTETGHRKGKVDSRLEWVLHIADQAQIQGVPVFMKEDLLPIMGEERMIQELPEQFTKRIQ